MNKILVVMMAAGLMAGCANRYSFEGQHYKGEKRFQTAVEQTRVASIAQVTPLPAPLSDKKLVAILPGVQAITAENTKRIQAENRRVPQGKEAVMISTLSKSNYDLVRAMYEGVSKRGIYKEVEIRDAASMVVSVEPSPDYDVIYFTEPALNSGQYFFASSKHGKQVFAYDRSGVGPAAKVNAFIEAVQALAIRN